MENGADLAVNVQLTLKDHLDLWKASWFRYFQWALFAIGLIYAYLALAEFLNVWNGGVELFTVALYVFVVVFATFTALVVPRIRAKLLFSQSPLAKEPRQYSISPDGVKFAAELSSAEYRWGAFVRIVETKTVFCLFHSPLFGLIVPKRCFASQDDVRRMRDMLRAHFQGKLRLIP